VGRRPTGSVMPATGRRFREQVPRQARSPGRPRSPVSVAGGLV